ncbi:N-acetylmuramoyl-L-alanine amidase [Macrococcus capreoli]
MKILLIAGHGYGDPGAVGNGTNEKEFIRKSIVPNIAKFLKLAGHNVHLYGGLSMSQDCFQDSAYGQKIGNYRDYGMYWVSNQGFDIVVEFHLDASSNLNVDGGHVIVASGLVADDIDKNLQNTLDKHVDTLHGISYRNDLLNVNIARDYGVNYRLVECGFITNKGDMDYIKNNLEAFTKDLADAINGKEITVPVTKKVAKTVRQVKAATSKPTYYTVKKGDSLWAIALKYKTTIATIQQLNNLKNNFIYPGQKLIVKK